MTIWKEKFDFNKAQYGIISHLGNTYTVFFPESAAIAGTGEFPFKQYDVPVIDLRNIDSETFLNYLRYTHRYSPVEHYIHFGNCYLSAYLKGIERMGIPIQNLH